jgi:hypothetical protein
VKRVLTFAPPKFSGETGHMTVEPFRAGGGQITGTRRFHAAVSRGSSAFCHPIPVNDGAAAGGALHSRYSVECHWSASAAESQMPESPTPAARLSQKDKRPTLSRSLLSFPPAE